MLRSLGITVLLCWGASAARSTTIVVVYSPKEISIAADSTVTTMAENGAKRTESACKIYYVGSGPQDVFFAVAGLGRDRFTNFSVSQIVGNAAGSKKVFTEKLAAVKGVLIPAIRSEARNLRETSPADLRPLLVGGVLIVLVGLQGGLPSLIAEKFAVSVDSRQNIRVLPERPIVCPSTECVAQDRNPYVLSMGRTTAIERFMARTSPKPFIDTATTAQQLVQLEIDDHPPDVGPPIDVLRITSEGPKWIRQKTGCPIEVGPAQAPSVRKPQP
jgi:hypothetical protein